MQLNTILCRINVASFPGLSQFFNVDALTTLKRLGEPGDEARINVDSYCTIVIIIIMMVFLLFRRVCC